MAHLNIVVVLLRTYQVISAILITVFVACLMRGLKGGLTNTTAGVAFDMAAATAAVALFMSLLVTVIRCSAAPRRKSLVVAMILDGFMTALSFSSAVVLTCELEIHDCRQLDIPALKVSRFPLPFFAFGWAWR